MAAEQLPLMQWKIKCFTKSPCLRWAGRLHLCRKGEDLKHTQYTAKCGVCVCTCCFEQDQFEFDTIGVRIFVPCEDISLLHKAV